MHAKGVIGALDTLCEVAARRQQADEGVALRLPGEIYTLPVLHFAASAKGRDAR